MARMTMIESIRDAMDVAMGRDDGVVVFGEDVGYFGGVFVGNGVLTLRLMKAELSELQSVWLPMGCGHV